MLFEEYLHDIPLLHSWDDGATWNAGGFDRPVLEKLFHFLRHGLPNNPVLLETGAGNSTIAMLFLQPARLISIAPDAQLFERIRRFCKKNGISDTAIEAHIDGSQWVLPRLAEDNRASDPILDFALIDGCHGWPTSFVDLEYTNSMLRQGGYLMIDDVHLHAEKEIARLLSEQAGFVLVLDLGKSLVFRKLTADRHLGEWVDQPYIVRRSREYAGLPNPFTLHDPLDLSTMAHWMRRLIHTANWMRRFPYRIRNRLLDRSAHF
ncbi:MAG: class I SAM-dependent methyltransferase [Verrucomicrobia bacterium]|nr:class I SAM-dependent methyltransferase [Verrucomicrobiota bacterium]